MKKYLNHFNFSRTSLIILCMILNSFIAYSDDYNVTVTGFFFGYDGTNKTTFPLVGARVEMWDSDADGSTLFDEFMGSSYIKADGSFTVSGRGGDPGNYYWSKPDVYIRVVFNNDKGVRLTDELDRDRYVDTPEHDHNNVEGTFDIGSWVTGTGVSDGDGTKPGVWINACKAYEDYKNIVGSDPPAGKYDVEYWSGVWSGTPWSNTNTTHWPIHYPTSAVTHEFGHTIRHSFDGDANHFNWDVIRFRYGRNHDICDPNSNRIGTDTHEMGLAFGFNEGWAEFWEGRTSGCWGVTIDDELEGNNAWALDNLSKQPGVGKKGMVQVLKDHPGQIHSIYDFSKFLGERISMTSSALSEILNAERIKTDKNLRPRDFPVSNLQAQISFVSKNIEEGKNIMKQMESEIKTNKMPKDCDTADCYKKLQEIVNHTVLKGDYSIKKTELNRLNRSLSECYRKNVSKKMRNGTYDKFISQEIVKYNQNVLKIKVETLNEVLSIIATFNGDNNIKKMFVEDMQKKLKGLSINPPLNDDEKKIRESLTIPFIFSEDIPKIKRE